MPKSCFIDDQKIRSVSNRGWGSTNLKLSKGKISNNLSNFFPPLQNPNIGYIRGEYLIRFRYSFNTQTFFASNWQK